MWIESGGTAAVDPSLASQVAMPTGARAAAPVSVGDDNLPLLFALAAIVLIVWR